MDKIKTQFGVLHVPEDPVPATREERVYEDRWPFFDSRPVTKPARKRVMADAT